MPLFSATNLMELPNWPMNLEKSQDVFSDLIVRNNAIRSTSLQIKKNREKKLKTEGIYLSGN